MSIIRVKTEESFAQKDAQLKALFQKSSVPYFKRLGKLKDDIKKIQKQLISSQRMSKASITKKMREIKKLDDQVSRVQKKGCLPRQYPKGVLLILEKKCPYCCKPKEYNRSSYLVARAECFIGYPEGYSEVLSINPGICHDCAFATALKSQRDSRQKGFWDTLFG